MSLTEHDIDTREAFLHGLAASAAALALDGFSRQTGQSASMKGPQDFLTETDAASETHIRAVIAERFPDDHFYGEEGGGVIGDRIWVVDHSEFCARNSTFLHLDCLRRRRADTVRCDL